MYQVEWAGGRLDLTAETPLDAAQQAFTFLMEKGVVENLFQVAWLDGVPMSIDLLDC